MELVLRGGAGGTLERVSDPPLLEPGEEQARLVSNGVGVGCELRLVVPTPFRLSPLEQRM